MDRNHEEIIELHPLLQQLRTNPISEPKHDFFTNSEGIQLFYRRYLPKSGRIERLIIGCHGASSDGEYFVLIADQIVEQTNSALYIMDYRGHGHSEGKKGDIKDFQLIIDDLHEFIEFLRHEYPPQPFFLMGESLGGIVSLNYVAQNPHLIKGLIEFAPAVRFHLRSFSIKDLFTAIKALFVYVFRPSKCVIQVRGREDFGVRNQIHQQYDFENPYHFEKISPRYILQGNKYSKRAYKSGAKITCPIIIFQGDEDKAVSVDGVKAYFQTIGSEDKELHIVPESYHVLHTDPAFPPYWEILRKWIRAH